MIKKKKAGCECKSFKLLHRDSDKYEKQITMGRNEKPYDEKKEKKKHVVTYF